MSDIKNIKDGAVTSIGDTDLVMCSVGGTYHPISFANLMAAVRGEIQIGGRNLLLGSGKSWSDVYKCLSYSENLILGEQYSFSVCIDSSIPLTSVVISLNGGNFNGGIITFRNLEAGKTVLKGTLVAGRNALLGFGVYCYDGSNLMPAVKSNAILVKGNMPPSDWTPAPEDIASGAWGG